MNQRMTQQSPAQPALQWPAMESIIGANRAGQWQEPWKYRIRMLLAGRYRQPLLQELQQSPDWLALYQGKPRLYHGLLNGFLDRRYSMRERYRAIRADLGIAEQKFSPALRQQLGQGQAITLAHIRPDEQQALSLKLAVNPQASGEGHWCLQLCGTEGQAIFNLNFAFVDAKSVLIGSVQGQHDVLASIQSLTKTCHGLRPHHLLLQAFLFLCQAWGITQIAGIAPRNHLKGRWNQRKRLKFDYEALWQETGGQLQSQGRAKGNWLLPSTPPRKALEEIASKKRSQYKKRYAMLDALQAELLAFAQTS